MEGIGAWSVVGYPWRLEWWLTKGVDTCIYSLFHIFPYNYIHDTSSNPTDGEVYSTQDYKTKCVSELWQVCDFLRVLRFPPPIQLTAHDITEMLLKVALNDILITPQPHDMLPLLRYPFKLHTNTWPLTLIAWYRRG